MNTDLDLYLQELFVHLWYRYRISYRNVATWAECDLDALESWLMGHTALSTEVAFKIIEGVGAIYFDGFCEMYMQLSHGECSHDDIEKELGRRMALDLEILRAPKIEEFLPLAVFDPKHLPVPLQRSLRHYWGNYAKDIVVPEVAVSAPGRVLVYKRLPKSVEVTPGLCVTASGFFFRPDAPEEVIADMDRTKPIGPGRGAYPFQDDIYLLQDEVFKAYIGQIPNGWIPVPIELPFCHCWTPVSSLGLIREKVWKGVQSQHDHRTKSNVKC